MRFWTPASVSRAPGAASPTPTLLAKPVSELERRPGNRPRRRED